jgi:DNA-3-methyladenine glycosylase II
MKKIIKEVGPCSLRPKRDRFQMLVGSIISQQISTGAARSIKKRLEQLCSPEGISAPNLSQFSVKQLRSAGVSPQKAKYILDLTEKVQDGTLTLNQIGRFSDDVVIERLTTVKGYRPLDCPDVLDFFFRPS